MAKQLGEMVVNNNVGMTTPRNRPTNTSQPGAPIKAKPLSQNQSMLQTNAQRKLNVNQGVPSRTRENLINEIMRVTKFNRQKSENYITSIESSDKGKKFKQIVIDKVLTKGGQIKGSSIVGKTLSKNGFNTKIKVVNPNAAKPASNYKSIIKNQKIFKKQERGVAASDKDVLALTLGRYASRIKYFKFKRSALLDINKNNYKKFVTCFDAGSLNGSLASTLIKSKVPYLTSVATMYDPGHKFRKEWHLNHYIKGAWYYFKRHMMNTSATDNQCYPEHFVDFSPIHINFLYGDKKIYTKIEFLGGVKIINKNNNSNNKNNSVNGSDMKTKLTVSKTSLNPNSNGYKNSNETLKDYVRFLLGKKFTDEFFNFISTKVKVLPYKPVVKTINLNNEGMLYAIRSDISHDYKGFKNNMETFKTKLSEEFKNNKFNSYTYYYNKKTTKTDNINRKIIISDKKEIKNTNRKEAPFFIKLLGDLSQIVYCMERNVFFATNDSSALNMAIRLSRSTGQIKRFKAFYEEETKIKVGMLYINYPVSYRMRP
ncbi:MAG: hypothetical protein ACO3JH_06760, partial [Flavobacteriaceae bacterium]